MLFSNLAKHILLFPIEEHQKKLSKKNNEKCILYTVKRAKKRFIFENCIFNRKFGL